MDGHGRHDRCLLWLGLFLVAAAAFLEFLWLARTPQPGGGMAFGVRRLGVKLELSGAQYEALALAAAAGAALLLVAAFFPARRAIRAAGAGKHGSGLGRLVAAAALLVALSWPLYLVVGWADGAPQRLKFFGAEWHRQQLFRALGLGVASQTLWLAALLALGGYLLTTPWRWPGAALCRLVSWLAGLPRGLLVGAAALILAALAAGFSLRYFDGMPQNPDATVYYFQAKVLASGHLWSPLPGGRDFFDPGRCAFPGAPSYAFLAGRWFGVGLPAAPVLFAVGMWAGYPWMVSPLLGGLVVVMIYFLAREVFGPGAALAALPLAALSPWLAVMSGEYLTHVPSALTLGVFLLAALRAMRRASWGAAAIAGLFLGIALNVRPYTAAAYCVPAAIAWAVWLVRRPRQAWRPTLAFLAALAVPLAGFLAYNAATTGSATTLGYEVAQSQWKPMGVLAERTVANWGSRPTVVLYNFLGYLHELGIAVFRWPLSGGAAVAAALVLLGAVRGQGEGRWGLLLVVLTALSLALGYARVPEFPISMGGPRYVFAALPLLVVLAAGAVHGAGERLAAAGIAAERVQAVLSLALVFCLGYAGVRMAMEDLPRYRGHFGVDARMFRLAEAEAAKPAIVFVPDPLEPGYPVQLYAALARNAPGLDGPILYARDLGPRNGLLAAARPGRHPYRWNQERSTLEPLVIEPAPLGAEEHR